MIRRLSKRNRLGFLGYGKRLLNCSRRIEIRISGLGGLGLSLCLRQ